MHSKQVLISSNLQKMELARWIKSMEYDSKDYQIVVTLKDLDEIDEVGTFNSY